MGGLLSEKFLDTNLAIPLSEHLSACCLLQLVAPYCSIWIALQAGAAVWCMGF
ncbi:hypothetical protein BVRB_6g156100 [Beta vulgaris subsp. vulgaris]|uniref:Uncharacterized protein n=1 Tax=Beta vulgaris subsp. vulgaris TaxID=3555 RepID=A0A0J8B8M7_BETVV|nr:hypothetical protein BVRB_6g156100 [Beta vulgaris subsp. vulgaris]